MQIKMRKKLCYYLVNIKNRGRLLFIYTCNLLIFQNIQIPLRCLDPILSAPAKHKALSFKQFLAGDVCRVHGAMHLMEQQVTEKILNAQLQCGFGVTLLAKVLVDKDAKAGPLVESVVVEDVQTADGLPGFGQVNHQAELPT